MFSLPKFLLSRFNPSFVPSKEKRPRSGERRALKKIGCGGMQQSRPYIIKIHIDVEFKPVHGDAMFQGPTLIKFI